MKTTKKQIGEVGVDSGQLLVCDPCYIETHWHHPTKEEDKEFDFEKAKYKGQFSFAGCVHATLSKQLGGELNFRPGVKGAGVTVQTGFGDGVYPVYAYYKDGRILKIEINF